jgi:hypothetical protein
LSYEGVTRDVYSTMTQAFLHNFGVDVFENRALATSSQYHGVGVDALRPAFHKDPA